MSQRPASLRDLANELTNKLRMSEEARMIQALLQQQQQLKLQEQQRNSARKRAEQREMRHALEQVAQQESKQTLLQIAHKHPDTDSLKALNIDEIPTRKPSDRTPRTEPILPAAPITKEMRVIKVQTREEKLQADIAKVVGTFSQEMPAIRRVAIPREDYDFLLDAIENRRISASWRIGYPTTSGPIPWWVNEGENSGVFYCF